MEDTFAIKEKLSIEEIFQIFPEILSRNLFLSFFYFGLKLSEILSRINHSF